MASNSNTQRVLRQIVSLEAWHDSFSEDCPTVELFASVRFNQSNFGGDHGDQIQFTLTLKNAELVVIPDDSGILNIPNRHVRRDRRHVTVSSETTQTSSQQQSAKVSFAAGLKAKVSGLISKARIGGKAKVKVANSGDQTTKMKQSHHGIVPEHAKDQENHRWLFSPAMGDVLDGHGWADDSPIMKLRHTKPSCIDGEKFPPYVKIQVKCFAKDLNIDNVKYLDKVNMDWIPYAKGKKLDLAKEVIKEELQKEGLLQTPKDELDMNRENALLVVADIIAVKELPDG